MQLGNGRWESTQLNNRLQPTQIALGATQNAANLLKLDYTYNTPNAADNNGNVKTQTITVPSTAGQNNGFTATQTYNYDSLNRLKDASETIGGNQTWKQTFNYDRFGNRTFNASQTTTLGSCSQAVCNPSINTADNRFNAGQGYSYDNAGNLKTDAEGKQFTYDAENKQTEVKNQYSQSIGTYFYDADGRRIKKVVPGTGETTVFIYDASGKLVAEYSTIVETTNAKVSYLTEDNLGSPRIITDKNGNVSSRRDFLPFGEEIGVTVPPTTGRSGHTNYSTDNTKQKFTGYEKDEESGLNFAQARYYSNRQARFTSPDPLLASGKPEVPQSWNRYVYVLNSPTKFTDPSGLIWMARHNTDGSISSIKWFGKGDKVEDGYTAYFGPTFWRIGDNKYVFLNPDGPSGNSQDSDYFRQGWSIGSSPPNTSMSAGPYWMRPLAQPGGVQNTSLDIVFAFQGLRGIPSAVRSIANFFRVVDGNAGAAAIRSTFKIGRDRNIGIAKFSIEEFGDDTIFASSARNAQAGIGNPSNPMFKATEVGKRGLADSDSEYKLFEYIGGGIKNPNARGTVDMFTERKMCSSCAGVADQFRQRFPNINVTVTNGSKP